MFYSEKNRRKFQTDGFCKKLSRKKPSPKTEIIFHCKRGVRAGLAVKQAFLLGFDKKVHTLTICLEYELCIFDFQNKNFRLDWAKLENLEISICQLIFFFK